MIINQNFGLRLKRNQNITNIKKYEFKKTKQNKAKIKINKIKNEKEP
jgi:hypothetical protein